ncbi:MAG: GNAT family protein [Thermoplasmata archaeon]|jgi:RimJ/RimL family protein N-acetyltransferase
MAGISRPARRRIALLRFPLPARRVELVLPTPDQIPAFVRLLNEPSVARWTLHMPYPYRTRDGRAWIRKTTQNRREGRALSLTILRRADRAVLGGVGIHHLEDGGSSAEVGYWLGKEHRGHGYATEAVDLLVRTGFRRLGLHRIEALVFPANASSRALARRSGFRYEGRLRDEVRKNGRWRSTLLYARLASDPPIRR